MSEIAAFCIPLQSLLEYHKMGFKLIPLREDSKTPSVKWTDIYYNPEYWNEKKITEKNGLFVNVATTYGKIYVKDENGMDLYLHELDIDSQEVFERLVNMQIRDKVHNFVDEMCKRTFVVKTRKSFGYRIYWLSHKQHPPISTRKCSLNCEFEIKSDNSCGLGTLPPSIHRSDPRFRYSIKGQSKICIDDDIYDGLVKVLKDCLKPKEVHGNNYNNSSDEKPQINLDHEDFAGIIDQIKPYYRKGSRNDISFGLSGLLWREKVKLESAEKLMNLLCDTTEDEEKANRLVVLRDSYDKGSNNEGLTGSSQLVDVLQRFIEGSLAMQIVNEIVLIIGKYKNTIFSQLDRTVVAELMTNTCEFVCYDPPRFYMAHRQKKQILSGQLVSHHNRSKDTTPETIYYQDVIINALPTNVVRYESPINTEIKYEINFQTPKGRMYKLDVKRLDDIIFDLKVKGLVYKHRVAEEALAAVLNAYDRDNKVLTRSELETPGYYLVDGKIVPFKTGETKEPSEPELSKCAEVLNNLELRYKRKELFPTFIKWGIVAPFSYVLKQIDGDRWMQWLYLWGWTNCGKTTGGRILLAVWRKHRNKKIHDIGFANFDNVPRFGRAVSYNTYPILVNEVQLNDDKQKLLVEAMKHAIQSETARARLSNKTTSEFISAFSPCILTSNSSPPTDAAFLRRIIPIQHTKEDEPTEEEVKEFNKYFNENIDSIGILGDFVHNYIMKNQQILLDSENWKDIAVKLLTEFFKAAGTKPPQWIDKFVSQTQIEDVIVEQEQLIRGFLAKTINDTYNRSYRTLTSLNDNREEQSLQRNGFIDRLDFCINKNLIPFFRRKDDDILVLYNILNEMKRSGINTVHSLRELANFLQADYSTYRLGNDQSAKAVKISRPKLVQFILPDISVS